MNRLVAGMYGSFKQPREGLFGLASGRIVMSQSEACRDLQWYNVFGEKIGEGSLAASDLARIARELLAAELFIVLDIPADIMILRTMGLITLPASPHGIPSFPTDGLESFAHCIVAMNEIYVPQSNKTLAETLYQHGIAFTISSRSALRCLIAEIREKNIKEN